MVVKPPHLRRAFTLVEVLVFTAILSSVFVTTLAIATQALRISKTAEHRALAVHAADEVSEWLLSESGADWNTFLSAHAATTTTDYCFNEEPITTWPSTGACSTYSLNAIYKRDVTLTKTALGGGESQVTARIVVTWTEGNNIYTVPITILLNNT